MSIKRLVSLMLILVICSISLISFAQEKGQSQLDVYHINNEDGYMKFYLDGWDISIHARNNDSTDIYTAVNGSTFMKLKNLGDALNITLYWHQNTKEISFDANGESVVLKLDSKKAYVGNREVILNSAPFAKDGRTFVPLRFVSEALGIKVNYIDMRPEGEFAKQAILKNYPSIKKMIDLGSFRQGDRTIFNRLRVTRYDPENHEIGIDFEEVDKYRPDRKNRLGYFNVDIQNRTIYDPVQSKITVDGYEKVNIQTEGTDVRYSNLGKERNIPYRVKDYIANGQNELSNAEAYWWDDTHLEALTDETINKLYSQFLESGGNGDNIKDFAGYLSMNAPIYPHWKEVFEARFLSDWEGKKIVRYEYLGNQRYAVYVEGIEIPIVNVNTITGNYSGM